MNDKTPLHEQFDADGQPLTDRASAELEMFNAVVEAAPTMTGGAALNGWEGFPDPRQKPVVYDGSHVPSYRQPAGEEPVAWDTEEMGITIE